MSKDKHGHDYSVLLNTQVEHFTVWRARLLPDIFRAVQIYCLKNNQRANDDTQTHRVYRGQDLVQIIMDWPDLKPCYPPAVEQQPTAADLV